MVAKSDKLNFMVTSLSDEIIVEHPERDNTYQLKFSYMWTSQRWFDTSKFATEMLHTLEIIC